MNILFATMQYGASYTQGTERYLSTLSRGLLQSGHNVSILAGDPKQVRGSRLLGEVVETEPFPVLHYPSHGNLAIEGVSPQQLIPWLERVRPDVVHLANSAHIGLGIIPACNTLGIPVIVSLMDYWWCCPKQTLVTWADELCSGHVAGHTCRKCICLSGARPSVRSVLSIPLLAPPATEILFAYLSLRQNQDAAEWLRWWRRGQVVADALQMCDQVICPSETMLHRVQHSMPEVNAVHVPYGVDDVFFASGEPLPPWAETIRAEGGIGFAGGVEWHKGLEVVLRALKQMEVPPVLYLAGIESLPSPLQDLAKGLELRFLGSLDGPGMSCFYRAVSLLVVPSRWPENTPFVVLEAQACGTAVLASRVPGIAEHLPEACLFTPGDATELAQRLQQYGNDREKLPDCTTNEILGSSQMVSATIRLYQGRVR